MANYCTTQIVITGNENQVKEIFRAMKECENGIFGGQGYGKTSLGNLVTALGGDNCEVYCRGCWDVAELNGNEISTWTESAWAQPYEVFDFIKEKFPEVEIYYIAEEPGCCVYETNDVDGRYFSDRYLVDWNTPHGCEEPFYFENLGEALEFISKEAGREINTMEDVEILCNQWQEQNEDYYVYLNEFEVVA